MLQLCFCLLFSASNALRNLPQQKPLCNTAVSNRRYTEDALQSKLKQGTQQTAKNLTFGGKNTEKIILSKC